MALVVGLVILGTYQGLVFPIVEMGLTPTRDVRASGSSMLPPSIRNSRPIIWNLVVVSTPHPKIDLELTGRHYGQGWRGGSGSGLPLINATEVRRHTDNIPCRSS